MIKRLIHISDVHIRNVKRHNEYDVVFERLFDYIDTVEDSAIVLTGDIVHSKTDMSPELIAMTSKFLKGCADRRPTVLILGNHDFIKHRLDALTPIVQSLNHPNLHYWKHSGVYSLEHIAFSVFSIADKPDSWVYAKDIDAKFKIALHHGPVVGALTDHGMDVGVHGLPVEYFDGFDLGILGDIHRLQYLNKKKTIAYSSSLVGQNFAEHPTKHGILVWDLDTKKSKFVQIKSDYAYVTFDIDNGVDMPLDLPSKLRVRIRHENATPLEIDSFVSDLGRKYEIVELIRQKVIKNNLLTLDRDKVLGDSRSIEYQNRIIADYLIPLSVSDDDISAVCKLNAEINAQLPTKNTSRNVIWKIKRLEWDNMFSYGEGNVIEFDQLSGVYSINGKNAVGKSSALNILCFALFDKTTVSTKGIHVLNVNKNTFRCKVQFEVDGVDYFVERRAEKKKDGAVRVDVSFWQYDNEGHEVSLNGEDRDKTNYAIRERIGIYDDFVMTALSTQYDNQSFVDKSQKERKELLYRFLDVTVFDELYRIAKESYRRMDVLVKEYGKDDLLSKMNTHTNQISGLEADLGSLDRNITNLRSERSNLANDLDVLNKEYSETTEIIDIQKVEQDISDIESKIEKLIADGKTWATSKSVVEQRKSEVEVELSERISKGDIGQMVIERDGLGINGIDRQIMSLKHELEHCESKKFKLGTHEYDPNCPYCTSNQFVVDAVDAISKIDDLVAGISELETERISLNERLGELNSKIEYEQSTQRLNQQLTEYTREIDGISSKIENIRSQIYMLRERRVGLDQTRERYQTNLDQNKRNADILRSITKIKQQITSIDSKIDKLLIDQKNKFGTLTKYRHQYEDYRSKYVLYQDYLKQIHIYDTYMKAIYRDGVPYKILQAVLPVIESEVNIILQQIVDFSVKLETTDEKYVHAHIVYGDNRSWPVDLTSGMERFVISLAFRQALTEITSLPRPNFMAIDEGFGVLDSDNLASVSRLFDYLKGQYDFILVISHIDSMRDMMDKQIRIDKINGYSKIVA